MLYGKGRGRDTNLEVLAGIQARVGGGLDQSEGCGSDENQLDYGQIFNVVLIGFGAGSEGKKSQW